MWPSASSAGSRAASNGAAAWLGAEPNLELIQPVTGPSIFTDSSSATAPHEDLGYFVDDFAAPKADMESLGYEEITAAARRPRRRRPVGEHRAPDHPTGLAIEIVEPPKRRREPYFRLLD